MNPTHNAQTYSVPELKFEHVSKAYIDYYDIDDPPFSTVVLNPGPRTGAGSYQVSFRYTKMQEVGSLSIN